MAGSIRGEGVVRTGEHITTGEHIDAVVVLDQQHSIRLGQRRKYRGSHVHARDKPFPRIRPRPRAALEYLIHRSQRRAIAH